VLSDFSPLRSGKVTAVLSADGRESEFVQDKALRDGIFSVEITPAAAGTYALIFRVESEAGNEDIASGTVRVTGADAPADAHGDEAHAHDGGHGETVSFLKEQQWRTAFSTVWAAAGDISASVRAPAVVRAAAGAEVLLTAPLDGVVSAETRVFVGREVGPGDVLVSLAPRASSSMSLPELEAETSVAKARLARLEELLKIEAVSVAEVEVARARVAALEPQLAAAKGSTSGHLVIRAPFGGRVADVRVGAGAAVTAGDPLLRLVRTPPVWIEVAVAPRDVARLGSTPTGLALEAPGADPVVFDDNLRLVSVSPEIDRATGAVTVIFEIAEPVPYPLGSLVTAEIFLPETQSGVVVPASAIVDDAGAPVVYVQLEGESFERRTVLVVARQGAVAALEGIRPGERVVVRGGTAIRRASLLSSGEVEGHVH
jgi:RND family efflux transporter MFP subunit